MKISENKMYEGMISSILAYDHKMLKIFIKLNGFKGMSNGVPKYLTLLYHAVNKMNFIAIENLLNTEEYKKYNFNFDLIHNWLQYDTNKSQEIWEIFKRYGDLT